MKTSYNGHPGLKLECLLKLKLQTTGKAKGKKEVSNGTLATAVPEPIAIPMSAFFSAGASLTPSPVMAT